MSGRKVWEIVLVIGALVLWDAFVVPSLSVLMAGLDCARLMPPLSSVVLLVVLTFAYCHERAAEKTR